MSELKNPEEYLANIGSITIGLISYYNTDDVLKVIKEVQIDAYNQALEDAANHAEIAVYKLSKYSKKPRWKRLKYLEEVDLFSYDTQSKVDKQSILKLKK